MPAAVNHPPAETPASGTAVHIPVMLDEVLHALQPRDGALYVDGTFGAGGYTCALLNAAACKVYALDRDPQAIARGRDLVRRFAGRLELIEGRFGDMERLLTARGIAGVDGIVFDLGLSSPQIDEPARGFSFRADGPLDMRMGSASEGSASAADLVNRLPEAELAEVIFRYGEERQARRIARAIVAARAEAPIARTLELAAIVRRVVRKSPDGIDPATRTFQALRITVNDELGELQRGLAAAERLLNPGGWLAVVSFHSLEDREVKTFLRGRAGEADRGSRHRPDTAARRTPSFRLAARKPLKPGDAEIRRNPRARSARLRAAQRTDAPAWDAELHA
ncbi:MAG: 16S rRNA (cytosine(1402)-N(4))-methyltransferase RsmH [Alphaproteobacteria bacterium]|nr:16S rRNA (cytosine(1402)-N(4))-methyltransferase RsmH [Alphaproteobacteria bacterium]